MITVIRHRQTETGFMAVITDHSNKIDPVVLQCYHVDKTNGSTMLEHNAAFSLESGAFSLESGAINAFNYGISAGQIEELKNVYKEKKFALAGSASGLAVVIDGETGYYPLPTGWKHDRNMQRSYGYADAINVDFLGLEDKGMSIIAQSMRG